LQRLIRLPLLKISNDIISDLIGEEGVLIIRMIIMMEEHSGNITMTMMMMKIAGEVKGNHTMIPIFAAWLVSGVLKV